MGCTSCGDKPTNTAKDFTKAVIEINNPETLVLLRKVVIPASISEADNPPAVGKYRNVILKYEDTGNVYLYSSDGIPTAIEANVPQEILDKITDLEDDIANEVSARQVADTNLGARIDGVSTALSNETTARESADSAIQGDIDAIEEKIPNQASSQNQLADKAFVNSSIATNTANYISDNGQPFQSLAALEAYSGTLTNNDYAFVVGTDQAGNTTYTRYKYVASAGEWAEEYVLNNSSFTAVQWAAINSNITSGAVDKLNNIANIQSVGANLSLVNGELSATDTTYSAGAGLNLNGTEFSVDTTTIAEKSDIPTKTSELVNDGADGSHTFLDTNVFNADSSKQSVRGGYGSGDLSKNGTVSLGDAALATQNNAIAIGARAHARGTGSIAIGSSDQGQGEMPVSFQNYGIAIGYSSRSGGGIVGEQSQYNVALGANSKAGGAGDTRCSVAIGAHSLAVRKGQVDISTLNAGVSNTYGYNNSAYRLLTGLYDPQDAHDAATKGYVDNNIPATFTTNEWNALWA